MLDSVRGGDTVELALLLAFRADGGGGGGVSSFSHIVLISVLWLRCGCAKAVGGSEAVHGSKHPM